MTRRMGMRMTAVGRALVLLIAVATAGWITPARAWSEETHQITGAIAYRDLAARDPAVLAGLVDLARAHPHYPLFARRAAGLPPATRDRALFEWLGRWPDDIRGGPDDRPKWHYLLHVVHGRTWLWPLRNGAANDGFAVNYQLLADPCADPASRAKAIGWLIHIIGDIQQPLHAGHQMTAQFPLTDRAGGTAFVRRPGSGEITDLHQFWDKIIERGGAVLPAGEHDWAAALMSAWPRSRLAELTRVASPRDLFASYLVETGQLARLVAYRGSFLAATPDRASAPMVGNGDAAVALALAKRRIATGGYRIADMLAMAFTTALRRRDICPR